MVKRTSEQAEETRRAILDAARHLFETQGYPRTSIANIVEAAGISKGALFHHFASKDALFFEIWKEMQLEMDGQERGSISTGHHSRVSSVSS